PARPRRRTRRRGGPVRGQVQALLRAGPCGDHRRAGRGTLTRSPPSGTPVASEEYLTHQPFLIYSAPWPPDPLPTTPEPPSYSTPSPTGPGFPSCSACASSISTIPT